MRNAGLLVIATTLLSVNLVNAQTVWEDFTSPRPGLSTEFRPTPFLGDVRSVSTSNRMRGKHPMFKSSAEMEARDERLKQLSKKILLPLGGPYLGDMIIHSADHSVKGPISVQFQYYAVDAKDITYPKMGDTLPKNFQLVPNGPLGKSCGSYSYEDLPAKFPLVVSIPFLPVSSEGVKDTTNGISAAFITFVIKDVDGELISSGVLPAVDFKSGQGSYFRYNRLQKIGGESDEEKENTSFDGLVVKALPEDYSAYNNVESIWLTHKLLNSCTNQENLLRRLLMTGMDVSGPTSVVERLYTMVGIPSATNESVRQPFFRKHGHQGRWDNGKRSGFSHQYQTFQTGTKKGVFGTNEDVFDKSCSKQFSTYSLSCFGIFLLGAAVILIFVFCRLKGERRIVVWWLLPAWTVVFSLVALIIGLLVLDRRSKTDCTELRFAVSNWPEMLCHAQVKTISFDTPNYEWNLPQGADLADNSIVPDTIDRFAQHCEITESAAGLRVLSAPESCNGIKKMVAINWFEKAETPIQFSESIVTGAVPVVSTSQDMDDVYVRMGDIWHQLGPMQAGETREVNQASVIPPEDAECVDWTNNTVCKSCGSVHAPETGAPLGYPAMVDTFGGVMTLGVKQDTPLRAAPVWKGKSVEKGRTIWVTKWQ